MTLLYALLDCSSPRCDAEYEGYGTSRELSGIPCEECGHELAIAAWAEARAPEADPRAPQLQQRRAA